MPGRGWWREEVEDRPGPDSSKTQNFLALTIGQSVGLPGSPRQAVCPYFTVGKSEEADGIAEQHEVTEGHRGHSFTGR